MDYEIIIDEQLKSMDLAELEGMLESTADYYGIGNDISIEGIINDLINGTPIIDTEKLLDSLLELFMLEVKSAISMGCEIIIICIFIGLLTGLSGSFGSKTVSTLGTMICGVVIIALCIGNFYQTYDYCTETMETITNTMAILLPIMIPLLITMGAFSSGALMSPVILGAVTGFNFIMKNIVLPMIFLSVVFIMINSLADKNYIKKLAAFMRHAGLFITGLTITLFSGITAIQGIVTKSADGILINTAKFSLNNFIPIIGGFASDSLETVISCIGLIKNTVGLIGIIIIISLLVMPIVKMLAIAVVYKITAMISEPITDNKISDSLNEIGTAAITMTVVLGAGAFMFLIFITILMNMGGGSL